MSLRISERRFSGNPAEDPSEGRVPDQLMRYNCVAILEEWKKSIRWIETNESGRNAHTRWIDTTDNQCWYRFEMTGLSRWNNLYCPIVVTKIYYRIGTLSSLSATVLISTAKYPLTVCFHESHNQNIKQENVSAWECPHGQSLREKIYPFHRMDGVVLWYSLSSHRSGAPYRQA